MKCFTGCSLLKSIVVLIFLFSTPYLFAQKQLKYVPQAAQKITRVSGVINPKLPWDVQVRLSIPLLSRQVNTAVTSAEARQTAAKPVAPAHVPGGQTAVKNLPAYELNSECLKGVSALYAFHPKWKSELYAFGLTEQQLHEIEDSFDETDRVLFDTDDDGNWTTPKGKEWEYSSRFMQILPNRISLSESQVRPLIRSLVRLDDVFTWLDLKAFY